MRIDRIVDSGLVPDFIMRRAVRAYLKGHKLGRGMTVEERHELLQEVIHTLRTQPVALLTGETKRQHYEVPSEFFEKIMGPHMKYSCCLWERPGMSFRSGRDLAEAEESMLSLTARRARIDNGQSILELGCGWGALSLYIAQRFPGCRVTAVSHSATQKSYIDGKARALGLDNVLIITADMNDFETDARFDRVVSVEMFEHMRNYDTLVGRIHRWLNPGGMLFIHVFTIEGIPYFFDETSDDDWMGRTFFSGGIMPSTDLLLYFSGPMSVERTWKVDGRHYEKTLLAWLHSMYLNKKEIMPVLEQTYGEHASKWWHRWRMFFLSCAMAFGFRRGSVWNVTHYLFCKTRG